MTSTAQKVDATSVEAVEAEITRVNTVTDQIMDDILTAALEGGITYWCRNVTVKGKMPEGAEWAAEAVSKGAYLLLTEHEEVGGAKLGLVKADLDRGIRRAAAHWGKTVVAFHEEHDATMADVAVQFAIFGEIRYG